ncbi:store-operated calcium entry-associated regulatory factor-like [Babylonia areolata]|uniref:store-operated calcium entry-associated regulatory factor-like n=1 Tax=Babylonia areolata TaxID=304850 RepID=UPI003FD36E15
MGPSPGRHMAILFLAIVCTTTVAVGAFGGHPDRVLLSDVSVLTLHKDKMTAGRRSSPVPQLTCVGGTAKGYYMPTRVQCYNRGSDGYDIQWECKADMDNAFRFGSVEVTCEGYDHPNDPYILKGSCGLEFTLDLTEEGYQRYKQQKSHSYSDSHSYHQDHHHGSWGKKGKSVVGDLLFLGGIALVIYVVYKSCLAPSATAAGDSTQSAQAGRGDSPPPYSPPPYGFRQDYMPGSGGYYGSSSSSAGCQGSGAYTGTGTGAQNQGGGFWSGAATGGILGYLFGRNTGYGGYTHHHYQQPRYGWGRGYSHHNTGGWFSGWGSGGSRTSYEGSSSFFGSGSGGASVSSGTRTASGFGGTKRR